jgi:hypothetical protein
VTRQVVDREGVVYDVDDAEAPALLADGGYREAAPEEVAKADANAAREAKYGGGAQQALAVGEAVAGGLSLGLIDEFAPGGAERKAELERQSPVGRMMATAAGAALPVLATGGAASAAVGGGRIAGTVARVAGESLMGGYLEEAERVRTTDESVQGWNILTNAVAGAVLDGALRGYAHFSPSVRLGKAALSGNLGAVVDAAEPFLPGGARQTVGWVKKAWKASAAARGAGRAKSAGARAARDLGGEAAERAAAETPEEFAEAAIESANKAAKRIDPDVAMAPAAKADLEGRVPEASDAHLDWRQSAQQALKDAAADNPADQDVVAAWAKSTRSAEPADLLVAGQEAYRKLESEAARAVLRDGLTNAALFGDAAAATRQTFAGVDVLRTIDVGDLGAQLRGDTGRAILDALEQVDAGAKGLGVDAKIDLAEFTKSANDVVASDLERVMGKSKARQAQAGSLVLDMKAPAGLEKAHARFEKAVSRYEGKAAKHAQAEKDLAAAEEALTAADPDGIGEGPEIAKLERAVEKAELQRDRVSRDLDELEGAADEYYQAAVERGADAESVRALAEDVLARYAAELPPEYFASRKQFLGSLPTAVQAPDGPFFLSPSGQVVDVAARQSQRGSVDIGGTLKGVATSPLGMGVAVGGVGAGAIALQDDVTEALSAMSKALDPMVERAARALAYDPPSRAPVNPISRFSEGFSDPVSAFRSRTDILARIQTDPSLVPELLASELGDIAETHPELFQREAGRLATALGYLQENWPRPGGQTALRPDGLPPSREQMRKAALLWSGALDATDVLDDLTNGVASPVQLEAMRATNPELYARLEDTVRQQMALAPERMGNQRKAYLDILFDTDGAAGASFSWAVSKFRPPPDAVESHAQLGDTAAQQPSQPRGMASVASGPTNR